MSQDTVHVLLAPADYVTDLDEWYGRLDEIAAVSQDARWHAERGGIAADLPLDEATRVLRRAREVFDDALTASVDPAEVIAIEGTGDLGGPP